MAWPHAFARARTVLRDKHQNWPAPCNAPGSRTGACSPKPLKLLPLTTSSRKMPAWDSSAKPTVGLNPLTVVPSKAYSPVPALKDHEGMSSTVGAPPVPRPVPDTYCGVLSQGVVIKLLVASKARRRKVSPVAEPPSTSPKMKKVPAGSRPKLSAWKSYTVVPE